MTARRARSSPPAPRWPSVDAPDRDIFRLEGEYWTIAYQGALFRLRDAKGLRYLAHLLLRPGQRFPAAELVAAAECAMRNADCELPDEGDSAIRNPKSAMDERARLAVTKRIKAAVKKIAHHHVALGLHLIGSIKTGYQCAYLPDRHDPTSWSH
jgi:hypothetical protein